MREKQILRQEGATGSTNAQAGRDLVVVQGFSPEDVQAVIREVITANALQMRDVAATVADERISHFAEKFIARASDEPELVQATGDPDMQQAVIEAGLGFARSGDEHLADVLLDLLTDRAKEPPRTLLALVINDAVTVAPRVTDGELAILTLYWRLVHTVSQRVTTLDSCQRSFTARSLLWSPQFRAEMPVTCTFSRWGALSFRSPRFRLNKSGSPPIAGSSPQDSCKKTSQLISGNNSMRVLY